MILMLILDAVKLEQWNVNTEGCKSVLKSVSEKVDADICKSLFM